MERMSSGHSVEKLDPAVRKKYLEDFPGMTTDMIKIYPGEFVLPSTYINYEKKLFDFKFRPDDVLVMTYPKCGTTWTQEVVWTMRNNPNLDNPIANEDSLMIRSPYIDADMFSFDDAMKDDAAAAALMDDPIFKGFFKHCPGKDPKDGIMMQVAEALPSPRTLKTHLPFSLLNRNLLDTCKVVYVARNPKDVVLSLQHHYRLFKDHDFSGSQDTFVNYFVENLLMYGSYAEHLKEAWQLRHHPNLLLVFYEDLKKDTLGQLRRLDAFMGTELTEAQLLNVQQHTSFNTMKANDPVKLDGSLFVNTDVLKKDGGFLRNGQAGSWKGKYTAEQEKKIDDWIKKNFDGHGLQFTYQ